MLIEIETFRLAEGADEAQLRAADTVMQTAVVPNLTGFLRRTTARGDDGEWAVVTLWADAQTAHAAAAQIAADPRAVAFKALIDPATSGVRRYTDLGG